MNMTKTGEPIVVVVVVVVVAIVIIVVIVVIVIVVVVVVEFKPPATLVCLSRCSSKPVSHGSANPSLMVDQTLA